MTTFLRKRHALLAGSFAMLLTAAAPQADQPSQDAANRKISQAGADARSVGELQAGITNACAIQPWQIALRNVGPKGVRIEASSTLPRPKLRCAFAVVGNSRYFVTNPARERP